MSEETIKQIHSLAAQYKKHGITIKRLKDLVSETIELYPKEEFEDIEQTSILVTRALLAYIFDEPECFTIDEVSLITGYTPEKIKADARAMGLNLYTIPS